MYPMLLIILTEFLEILIVICASFSSKLLMNVPFFFSQKTHSTVIIIILAFMSFLTATFVIESMACANAITNHRKIQRLKSRISVSQDKDSSSSDHDTEVDIVNPCSNDNYINQNDNEHEPLLSDMERVGELEIRRAPEVNSR